MAVPAWVRGMGVVEVRKNFFHTFQKTWFRQIIINIIIRKLKKIKDLLTAGSALKGKISGVL